MKLFYTVRSLRHLQSIHNYIAQDDPAAADRVVRRIREATSQLENFTYMGRPGPKGTRLLSVPGVPYIVVHRVRRDRIDVLTILHTSRNRPF